MALRVLHLHSTFQLGGKEARAVRLMNAFGGAADHVVLSATPCALSARDTLDPGVQVTFPGDRAPPLVGRPTLTRYWRLARYMADFDLILTYNWGAMDAVGARRSFGSVLKLPPLVHHEDGFNSDEANRQKPARILFRRATLATAFCTVVPSERLERIARREWHQPSRKVCRIPNGIAFDRFGQQPAYDAIPGFRRAAGDVVIGTMAGLRTVKNLSRLVRILARSGPTGRLVIVGEGPDRNAIMATAQAEGIADRVLMPGFLADPARYIGHFDIFALSSDSEQLPIALIEAMASGLPVVSTDVGDVVQMVAAENRRYILPPTDEAGLAEALGRLIASRDLRHRLGSANRAVAADRYDERRMISAYRTLYETAIGLPGAFA